MTDPRSAAPSVGTRPPVKPSDWVFYGLFAVTAILTIYEIHLIFLRVPIESTMGIVQKIFYFHVPIAYSMYLGATACFVGSAGYLYSGKQRWDSLARAGAEVAVVMGLMVLVSGPLWAAKAWGSYWSWEPQIITPLLSWFLYVSYLVLRIFTGDGEAERKFAAALGVLGAANLPIIHFSVQKWGGNHPRVIGGNGGGIKDPLMIQALMLGFLAFTLFTIVLLWSRFRVDLSASRLAELEQEALELGIGED